MRFRARRHRPAFAWAAVAGLVAAIGGAAAAEGPLVAGIGGVHRTGFWTPLVVRPPVGAGEPAGTRAWVDDADGQLVGSPPLALTTDGVGRACVRPGRPLARLVLEPAGQGGSDAESGPAATDVRRGLPGTSVPSTTQLLLVHGELAAAAGAVRLVAGERAAMQVVRLTDGPVPPRLSPRELDAFNAAVICGRAVGALEPDTLAAIDGWVRRGGRLVFIAGASAEAVAAAGGVAADWLPGVEPELVPLRRFGGIEAYARSGGLASRVPQGEIRVPRFRRPAGGGRPTSGVVEAFEGGRDELPLLVRRGHGFGTINWLGLDIDEPWYGAWPGCDRLLAALLRDRGDVDGGLVTPEAGRPTVPDLAGQLRVALDTFTAGGPPAAGVPFEVIAGLGLLYVLALYPFDWWLVSRSGRPGLSWLTLPLLAAGFSLAAWAVGGLWGRDTPARSQAAEVVDIDAASRLVRGSAWLAARSPENAVLDVAVAAEAPLAAVDFEAALSWCADAGRGFGGVDAPSAHPSLAAADYRYGGSLAALEGVPIAAGASRLFEAEWTATLPGPPATSTLTRDSRGLLQGAVSHHLPFALTDCRLLHGGWLYDIGNLAPDDTFDPDAGRGPRSLGAELTRRGSEGGRDKAERWDSTSLDVARILELAGFHAAAGGIGYTAIEAGRLARLDLSSLIDVDRAVLVGVAPAGTRAARWQVDLRHDGGAARPLAGVAADGGSLVRIVIPVPPAADVDGPSPEAAP
ncbi:MAG: hypothetical protein ACKOCX_04480 [Planctomycetota bacterium]